MRLEGFCFHAQQAVEKALKVVALMLGSVDIFQRL
ncbi:HEPN domain-containing protein [Candidatus Poribacteria bacterium]|nr:HEPN domain-containing protein [Candidatus Poribacteria bacterium]